MGPDFVVVLAPFRNPVPGLCQALKPLLIQAFVSELSIETLDVTVLHGPARLNQNVANAMQSADRAGAGYGNCLGLAPQGCMLGVQRVGVRPPSS